MSCLKGSEMDVAWHNQTGWQGQCASAAQASDGNAITPLYREERQADLALLTKAIEDEIIPRLLHAKRSADVMAARKAEPGWQPDSGEIDHFARLVLDSNEGLALNHLRGLADKGVRLEAFTELLLGATARHLGRMWDDDTVNFTAVTTGVWRLQEIMRSMSAAFVGMAPLRVQDASILLVPAIGCQHSFGLAMVAEHFLRAGWDVRCERAHSDVEMSDLVQNGWFDIIGFSVGATDQISPLTSTIAAVRKASRNRHMGVMVGGPVFVAFPDSVAECGADATASDARQAIAMAERLVLSVARAE